MGVDAKKSDKTLFTTGFVDTFGGGKKYAQVLKSNRGAFVLRAACDVVPSIRASLTAKDLKKRMQSADKGSPTAGYDALLKFVDQKDEK